MANQEIKVIFGDGLKVNVKVKEFTVETDQPVHQGGTGTAPSPFDLFLASIASCAGFYTLAFCRERDISYDNIKLVMKTEKGETSKMIEKITFELDLPPDFPEKYKFALTKAIDTCTVKAHILKPPRFEIIARPR